jgi:peptidoglycan/LPS O-acetylase OafA/YrhL
MSEVRPSPAGPRGAPHFAALDSLRGVAALSVVLFHLKWRSVVESANYVRNSYLMVDLFFVLSGFVVFYAYGDRIKALPDAARFMWLRFWRLYPLHFAMLLVFLAIECLKGFAQWRYGIIADTPAFSTNNLSSFIGNLFLVQTLPIFPSLTYNAPAWSISVEFFTYIVFALLMMWAGGKRAALLGFAAIFVLSMGALVWLGWNFSKFADNFRFAHCLAGFFLGALTFAFYQHLQSADRAKSNSKFAGWLALAVIAGFIVFLEFKQPGFSDLVVYPFAAAMILAVALAPADGPTRFLNSAPFVWLGTVSYSIYMVHASIEWIMNQILRHMTHAREDWSPLRRAPTIETNGAVGLCAVIATVALVLIVSHFTYAWIEKPFRDWSKTSGPFKPAARTSKAEG